MTKVKMSCCPNHCQTCQTEVNEEHKARLVEAEKVHACHAGLMLSPYIEMNNILDFVDLDDNDNDEEAEEQPPAEDNQLEEGDRLFTMTVPCEA
jgi:hypothetical protein